MTPKEADERLWKYEYTSLINQYYYEIMKHRWKVRERIIYALNGIAFLSGVFVLGIAIFGQPTNPPQLLGIGGTLLGVFAFFFLMVFPVDAIYRHQAKLYQKWTDLRGKCERLHLKLDASPAKTVDSKYLAELQEIMREHTEIQKLEGRADENFLRFCQQEINKRTYGVNEGTYGEVMEKLKINS